MTTEAQKRATNKYNADKKVIGCKISKELAEKIEIHFKEKGYKSFNEYIKDLIMKDSGIEL